MKQVLILTSLVFVCSFFTIQRAAAQQTKLDSLFQGKDTTAVLDSLMADFDSFLDSLSQPRSFFSAAVSAGTGYFSFENKNSVYLDTKQKLIISPTLGYYHKSGLGLSATAFIINDDNGLNLYQYALSPSYDFINRSVSTGISYTRYFNKDSLDFYTTPINNELFAYFSYKRWWIRPTVSVSYGWGGHTEYEKRKLQLAARRLQQLANRYYIIIRNDESVQDLAVTASLRHDFNWYDVLGNNDNISVTPVVLLTGGTQLYGFNTSYSYNFNSVRTNSLPSNDNITDQNSFALQTAGAVLRVGYLKGRFFVQPQVLFSYYIPESDDPFRVAFSLMAGINL